MFFYRKTIKKIALLRPHKTGSTSFHEAISSHFDNDFICDFPFAYQFTSSNDFRGNNYYWPHMTLPQFEKILDKEGNVFQKVIPVRDPVSRLLSVFNYFKNQTANGVRVVNHNVAKELHAMGFDEFLASNSPTISRARDNTLTAFLSFGEYGISAETRAEIFVDEKYTSEQCLERAKLTIQRKDVTFLDSANTKASAKKIAQLVGVSPSKVNIPHSNKTINKHATLDDELLGRIRDHLRYDLALYDLICRSD